MSLLHAYYGDSIKRICCVRIKILYYPKTILNYFTSHPILSHPNINANKDINHCRSNVQRRDITKKETKI